MSFYYGEGRFHPEIKITESKSDFIEFILKNADVSFANSLRRVIISEVPTMSIDMVEVRENTSPLFDDFVVHRIGLVPLVSEDIDNYKFPLKCSCKEGCSRCQVSFVLSVKCDENCKEDTMEVTSNDIIPQDKECKVKPVDYGNNPIILTKLKKGQSIDMTLTAKKGIGKTHAKWSPVCTCVMKPIPNVEIINIDGENFLQKELTPENKIDKKEFNDFIQQKKNEGMNDNDIKKLKMNQGPSINYREVIKVEPKANEFLFRVESTGALSPKKIIYEAFKILKQKFDEIDRILNEKE